jgi:hypothetical protein
MSTQTLSTVAINVVGQYNQAGKHLVRAYRTSTERAVGAVNERFAAAVNARPLPLVSENVKSSLITAQQHLVNLVAGGLSASANGADATIDQLARGAKGGIERIAETGTKIETVFNTSVLDTVNVLALPAAYVTLEIGSLVNQRSKQLSERMTGTGEETVAEAPVKKPAAKKRAARTRRA